MKSKNIVVIMTDEQRHDSLSCTGHPVLQTPHMDAIAEEGCLFENAFCASPLCLPSRASFFTGQYVHRNLATSNGPKAHIKPQQFSLVELLKKNGYTTGLAGKNHTFDDAYMDQWFDYREEYFHFGKTHGTLTDSDRAVVDYYSDKKREGLIDGPAPFPEDQWVNQRIADDGVRFVETHKARPFFLYYSFPDPHWPNVACEPYYSMYQNAGPENLEALDIDWNGHPFKHVVQSQSSGYGGYTLEERVRILATYYGQISSVDAAIGRLMEKLKQLLLLDDTIIVFASDHGNFAGRYGLVGKTGGFFDALVRIPLVLRIPGCPTGKRSRAEVNNIDVMPTLLDCLGLEIPREVQGVSFLPVIRGEADTHRSEIYAEVGAPEPPPEPLPPGDFQELNARMIRERGPQWFCDYTCNGRAAMLRKDGWKYCHYVDDREEFYNINADPMEKINLATDSWYGEQKEALKNRLFDWLLTVPMLNNETFTSERVERLFF